MCNEIPFNVEKFPSAASVGNRAWIIKPAVNLHSATGRIETKRQQTTETDRYSKRDRDRQRGRDENSFTYTAATSLLNFSNQLFCS